MPPQVEIVFRALFEELRFMKRQQWTITNYGALILAAIYAVKLPTEVPHTYLKFLAIATAVIGSGLLLLIQSDMARSRCRLDKLHKGIGLTDKEIKNLGDEAWRRYRAHWYRGFWPFTVPLILVLWIGAVLVYFAL